MMSIRTWVRGIARLAAMAAVLLFAPFPSAMAGTDSPVHDRSHQSIFSADQTAVAADSVGNDSAPENQPLHCHLRTVDTRKAGHVQSSPEDKPLAPVRQPVYAFAPETDLRMPPVLAGMPGHPPPRFILFGNFRS